MSNTRTRDLGAVSSTASEAHPYPELAVALDVPTLKEATELARELSSHVDVCKVGLELLASDAAMVIETIGAVAPKLFVDMKLHDIPRTVQAACRTLAQQQVDYMTIHLGGGLAMAQAAVEGAAEGAQLAGRQRPKILGVSVLTSLSDEDLAQVGHTRTVTDVIRMRVEMAERAGIDGIVCSPNDLDLISDVGPDLLRVTPGIRFGEAQASPNSAGNGPTGKITADDQKRAGTPEGALESGSDMLVVGRPITTATDPAAVAQRIHALVIARRNFAR